MDNYNEAIKNIKKYFIDGYEQYGCSQKAMGIFSDRQNIRFRMLTENLNNFYQSSILDLGCGFGDFITYIEDAYHLLQEDTSPLSFTYTGIDMMENFINEARKKHPQNNVHFIQADLMDYQYQYTYDYVITSQTLNNRMYSNIDNNYEYVFALLRKAYSLADKAVAFNFFTDKGNIKKENTAYHNPGVLLEYIYSLSKNVIFKNNYTPYEATIIFYKDDSYNKEMRLFNQFIKENQNLIDMGFYHINCE